MRSIVILGAGELGGALARQLAAADICPQVTLVDPHAHVAEGKALDIRQAAPIDGYNASVTGTTDEAAAVGADFVVLADRFHTGTEWLGDEAAALTRRIAYLDRTVAFICAGARQMEVLEQSVRDGIVGRERILGSAPEALRSAIISMTALEARCSPTEVSLTVVGRPPDQLIVPWEDASIGGRRASEVLSPPAITRLDTRLVRLWPPGPLTLAAAATRMLKAAAAADLLAVSAFVAVTRPQGEPGRVAMLPVQMGAKGLASVMSPTLSARDRVRLDTALGR